MRKTRISLIFSSPSKFYIWPLKKNHKTTKFRIPTFCLDRIADISDNLTVTHIHIRGRFDRSTTILQSSHNFLRKTLISFLLDFLESIDHAHARGLFVAIERNPPIFINRKKSHWLCLLVGQRMLWVLNGSRYNKRSRGK